jgi:hypothetical protein
MEAGEISNSAIHKLGGLAKASAIQPGAEAVDVYQAGVGAHMWVVEHHIVEVVAKHSRVQRRGVNVVPRLSVRLLHGAQVAVYTKAHCEISSGWKLYTALAKALTGRHLCPAHLAG